MAEESSGILWVPRARLSGVARVSRPVMFLDDGGVINDPAVRRAQWYPLVAEFFVPRLGGTPEAWSAANQQVNRRMLDRHHSRGRVGDQPIWSSGVGYGDRSRANVVSVSPRAAASPA
jgi:hypothetical protein